MSGFIYLHRDIRNHWLWDEKPFDKRAAWIDILFSCNHQDNTFMLGNELIFVEQGSFITSELKLMERWGWSKTKVRNFLKTLEKDEMIIKKSDKKKTALTVVNYKHYQFKQTTERPVEDHTETTRRPQENTNNNVNKENNVNKVNKEDIYILSDGENKFLIVLESIPNYPLDRNKDLLMYKSLGEKYPSLNLLEAIESWRIYKMDKPLENKSNPRSQINTSFKNYVAWGKYLKEKGEINGKPKGNIGTNIDGRRASEESLRLERIAIKTGLLDESGRCKPIGEIDF